jgi:hypothetical protein
MIRLKQILNEEKDKRDAAMVSGVADILRRIKDPENRKEVAAQMLSRFDLEDVGYDKDSFLKLSGVSINEAGFPEEIPFEEFAKKRFEGASKIASDAKEKGGAALLTYHHFEVKLKYYKEAAEGGFDINKTIKDYNRFMEQLHTLMDSETPDPIEFQKVVGLIEVLGELIIKSK